MAEKRRIKLTVAYDGTNYHGWQQQTGRTSIEGSLNEALAKLLPAEKPEIIGASRTDAGVHARGNVGVFDTASSIPAENFPRALNRYLAEDIRIMAGEEVSMDFHPRFTAHEKCYEYHIDPGRIPNPMLRLYSYNYSFPLDLQEMQRAADCLTGVHDFRSFVNPDSQVFQHGGDAVREIYEIRVEQRIAEIVILIRGSGFLYHMIRIIVGTLLSVGTGRLSAEDMPRILEARDRKTAGPTVPAKGLWLRKLDYNACSVSMETDTEAEQQEMDKGRKCPESGGIDEEQGGNQRHPF